MSEPAGCTNREQHDLHICQLRKQGRREELAARTGAPGYICHNCNAAANRAEDLCNPSPFARQP